MRQRSASTGRNLLAAATAGHRRCCTTVTINQPESRIFLAEPMPETAADSPDAPLVVTNPFDQSTIGTLARQGAADADQALLLATDLYQSRSRRLARDQRFGILEHAARLMESRLAELSERVTRESGKPHREALAEIRLAIDHVRTCAAAVLSPADRSGSAAALSGSDTHVVATSTVPAGVVVAQGCFRDPLGSIVRQTAAAIAAGCPAIALPAPDTPLSCIAFAEILEEAGLPENWIQTVVIDDDEAVAELARHPLAILPPRAARGTFAGPDVAERGAGVPVVVAGDIDVYEAREILLRGCFRHAGQMHGSIQRIYAHTRLATRLATQLAMKASGIRVGDPAREDTEVGPLIRPAAADRIGELVQDAVDGGGQLLTGGQKLTDTLYAPTVIFNPPPQCRLMTEMASGPAVCVIPWFKRDDMLARVDGAPTERAAVLARDIGTAVEIADALAARSVLINNHTAFPPGSMPSETGTDLACDHRSLGRWIEGMQTEKVVAVNPARPPLPDTEPA